MFKFKIAVNNLNIFIIRHGASSTTSLNGFLPLSIFATNC